MDGESRLVKRIKIEVDEENESKDFIKQLMEMQRNCIAKASFEAMLEAKMKENSTFVKIENEANILNEEEGINTFEYIQDPRCAHEVNERGMQYSVGTRMQMSSLAQRANKQNLTNLGNREVYYGGNIFQCCLCQKTFSAESMLLEHLLRKHLKQRRCCPICKRNFKTSYTLKDHLKSVHLTKLLRCHFYPVCLFRTTVSSILQDHLNEVHKNIRPYKCEKCDRSFTEKWKLDEHLKRTANWGLHKLPLDNQE